MLPFQQLVQLCLFRRQYLQRLSPSLLAYPDINILCQGSAQEWLYKYVFTYSTNRNDDVNERVILSKGDRLAEKGYVCQGSFAPPARYQLQVLKEMVGKIERSIRIWGTDDDEISDELVQSLSDLMAFPLPSEVDSAQRRSYIVYVLPSSVIEGTSYRDLLSLKKVRTSGGGETERENEQAHLPAERSITVLENHSVISVAGNTGQRTWEAALHLAAFLVSEESIRIEANNATNFVSAHIRGKHILELGAGTGLVSILCSKYLGARVVQATDGEESVVDAMRTNFFLNETHEHDESGKQVNSKNGIGRIQASVLRWGCSLSGTSLAELFDDDPPDTVVAADVTYDKIGIAALITTLSNLFVFKPRLICLVSATVRNEETLGAFFSACERKRFLVETISFERPPLELQDGLFCSTEGPPIRILRVILRV